MAEQNQELEAEDFKVDIVDDTPVEDRNKVPMPKELVEEIEKDDLEEYSEKVQTRIKQMKKVFHDERRAKESAAREREEALRFAQHAYEENKQLKQRLSLGEKIFASETTKAASSEVERAKERLKSAIEAQDASAITDAQEALYDAKTKLKEFQQFRPLQEPEYGVQQQSQAQPQTVQQPQVDPKAASWQKQNPWFGADEEMTALALGLHEKLVRSGVDTRSDDYYRRVDETMKKRFPEYFSETQDSDEVEKPVRKTSTVVAPVARSTAPRQIRITATEAAIAKKLGLTPEAYAREKLKLESNNG
jgi:hypothetical protein